MTRAQWIVMKARISQMPANALWKTIQNLGEVLEAEASDEERVHYKLLKDEVLRRLRRGQRAH